MNWNPIITGKEAKPFVDIINKIIRTIPQTKQTPESQFPDVMYGESGLVLFYLYLSIWVDGINSFEEELNQSFEKVKIQLSGIPNLSLSLGQGVTGTLWMIQHLIKYGLIEDVLSSQFEEVLKDLELFSFKCLNENNYDYLLGGSGLLLIALEDCYEIDIEPILNNLLEIAAVVDDTKIAWKYFDPSTSKVWDNFNLGISHGNPAVILILSLIYGKFPKYQDKIMPYIEKAMCWLSGNKNTSGDGSYFSGYTTGLPNTDYTPLRWCYGDMGIGFCYYLSGIRLEHKEWVDEGIAILKNCVKRLDTELVEINEAHFCHGTAGIAHMFNRMYQYTQIEDFRLAAIRCFEGILDKAVYKDKNIFFYSNKGEYGNIPFEGLMEGSIGIALALLSAISDVEPKWDRLFLLS